jgi:hypothetical protein
MSFIWNAIPKHSNGASRKQAIIVVVGNTGVQLTVGRYGVLVDIGCGLGS